MWIDPLIVVTALVLYTALLFILLAWVSRTYSLVQQIVTFPPVDISNPAIRGRAKTGHRASAQARVCCSAFPPERARGVTMWIAAADDVEEILGRRVGQSLHAQVVDDEQWDGGDVHEVVLAGAAELGVGEFLEEDVGLAVEDAMPLLDHGEANGLREMAFARARRPQE